MSARPVSQDAAAEVESVVRPIADLHRPKAPRGKYLRGAKPLSDVRRARQLDAAADFGEALQLTGKTSGDVAAALGDVTASTADRLRDASSAVAVRDVLALADRGLGDTARAYWRLVRARLAPAAVAPVDVPFLAKLLRETADVTTRLAEKLEDGVLDDAESRCPELRRDAFEAIEALEQLVARMGGAR